MKKVLALVLALLMVLSIAACGGGQSAESPAPADTAETAETPGSTPPPAVTIVDPTPSAYRRAFEKLAPDEPMLEINGRVVRWREFFYWMHSIVKTIEAYYGPITDYNMPFDLDAEGHSDCLSYAAALDLSKLRLVVNDLTKLNPDCKYTIATNLTSCANEFASSNLPNGWYVKPVTSGGKVSLKLAFAKGTMVIVR